MSSFEVYTAIIQQKVYMENVKKRFRTRLEILQNNFSRAVGHYIVGITYSLPTRIVLSTQLMLECKDNIEKIIKVIEVVDKDIESLQKIIDNHFDEYAFEEYIKNFGKTVDQINMIMEETSS